MKGIYLLSLVVLMVSGCSYIRMHGGMTDDYLNEPQPIDYYVRPNLSPNAIVHDWVVCGGSVYGFYNWNFLNREYDINRYSKEITKCLEKKQWRYRQCNMPSIYNQSLFCQKHGIEAIPMARKSEYFQTKPLWKGSSKSVDVAYEACHAQEGRFWEPIVGAYIESIRNTSKSFNLERVVSNCLLKQGLTFQACPRENKLRSLFNEAAGGVEICPIQP